MMENGPELQDTPSRNLAALTHEAKNVLHIVNPREMYTVEERHSSGWRHRGNVPCLDMRIKLTIASDIKMPSSSNANQSMHNASDKPCNHKPCSSTIHWFLNCLLSLSRSSNFSIYRCIICLPSEASRCNRSHSLLGTVIISCP
jgi:hypothetical protein